MSVDQKTIQTVSKTRRYFLLIGVPVLAALVSLVIYLLGGRYVETENAYVKADKIPISAEISGVVKNLAVKENQVVTAGQVLFELDSAPFKLTLDKAQAQLTQAKSDWAALRASYYGKQAEISLAKTKYSFAQKDFVRQTELHDKNFISNAVFDDAKQAVELTQQQIVALEQDLKRIAENLGGSVDAPIERLASYQIAHAAIAQAQLDLAHVVVTAPIAGVVSRPPNFGQHLNLGATAMALVTSTTPWVEANFTETELTYIHPGQAVEVTIDTYPDQVWQGTVDSVSPATGAEFSLIPAQNATGNWVKITQRVPVRISLKPTHSNISLQAGLSTIVKIDTGHTRRFLGMSL